MKKRNDSVCKGCEKRHARCHAECEAYLAYEREYQAFINSPERMQRILADYD